MDSYKWTDSSAAFSYGEAAQYGFPVDYRTINKIAASANR